MGQTEAGKKERKKRERVRVSGEGRMCVLYVAVHFYFISNFGNEKSFQPNQSQFSGLNVLLKAIAIWKLETNRLLHFCLHLITWLSLTAVWGHIRTLWHAHIVVYRFNGYVLDLINHVTFIRFVEAMLS